MRHIVDEFIHVALAFPEILFTLTSNGQEVFHLAKGTLKQRIVQIMGSAYASKLVGVTGKYGLPEYLWLCGQTGCGQKNTGRSVLFCQQPFYQKCIPESCRDECLPGYDRQTSHSQCMFSSLTLTLHRWISMFIPTKQEIKFEDEKIVYAFVQAAVKHALAQYSVTPTLDFDLDPAIQQLEAVSKPFTVANKEAASASHLFQTFTQKHQAHRVESRNELQGWREFYAPGKTEAEAPVKAGGQEEFRKEPDFLEAFSATFKASPLGLSAETKPVQLHLSYILFPPHRE